MAKLLKELKRMRLPNYAPRQGSFLDKNNRYEWFSCREEFHDDCRDYSKFYYSLNQDQKIEDIICVLSFFEKKLKLKSQIKIQKVEAINSFESYNCFRFDLPAFWKCPVRNNLLTLIIKYIIFTNKSRSEKEIKRQLQNIAEEFEFDYKSIDLFLKGNVFYQEKEFSGWVDTFKCDPDDEFPLFNKPTKSKSLDCIFNENFCHIKMKKL